jgi:hypothetical protein
MTIATATEQREVAKCFEPLLASLFYSVKLFIAALSGMSKRSALKRSKKIILQSKIMSKATTAGRGWRYYDGNALEPSGNIIYQR